MWVYYTVLWRLAPASSRQHPTDPTLISQKCCAFPEGMTRQRGFRSMRVSPICCEYYAKASNKSSPQNRL